MDTQEKFQPPEKIDVLRCGDCGREQLPPRVACVSCGSEQFEQTEIEPEGEIYSYTVIRIPPARYSDDAPYTIVAVELGEGLRLTGRLREASEAGPTAIGQPVRLIGEDDRGYWFERRSA